MASQIGNLGKNFEGLVDLIASYEDLLDEAKAHLSLKGKTLGQANKDQMQVYEYDERRSELSILCKHMQAQVDKVRGERGRFIKENGGQAYSERYIDKIVDYTPEFLRMNELFLEVEDMKGKYEAVVEAFKTRGFVLRNLNDAKAKAFENDQL